MTYKFIDLFAGIGGFHQAFHQLGAECVFASEWDEPARKTYELNYQKISPELFSSGNFAGDITKVNKADIPDFDILCGGFPCQPFSKSGKQNGMDEARGTLFWNIARIIEVRKPKIVLLENVRNIAGPRHEHEWEVIIETLRQLGYRVSSKPLVVSPHRIHPDFGGRPQVRERVFIAATRTNKPGAIIGEEPGLPAIEKFEHAWNIQNWNLAKDLPLDTKLDVETMQQELQLVARSWIMIGNKVDSIDAIPGCAASYGLKDAVYISAKQDINLDVLKTALTEKVISGSVNTENTIVTNARHYQSLQKLSETLMAIRTGMQNDVPGDLLSIDIRQCLYHLGEITGQISNEDQLDFIFSKFCIGK